MKLSPGTRLGPYEIRDSLGAGGMGEVYRARDLKLDRDVAIKVLPEVFASDPDRLARFEREAKTLASLNHPNIAHIHGLEEGRALVMELVEGEDLSQRLDRGPVPLDEAVPIARQVADALEAAHDQGIIHRDLKPANVKVRPDGTVKVLDFGLAKLLGPAEAGHYGSHGSGPEPMNSPTFTSPAMTQMGMILGTAAYMAPEQARGKPADRRADIWAFGCVLYEMLTGKRPFAGDDISMTLAAVLKESVDFGVLPPDTPSSVRRLLRRCLEKDPRKRLSAIGDARLDLDEATGETVGLGPAAGFAEASAGRLTTAVIWRTRLMWGAVGALAAAVAMAAVFASRSPANDARQVVRSQISFTEVQLDLGGRGALALSPDGATLVFAGARGNERSRLYRRSLADDTVHAVAGGDGATAPFFSPDGQWLAFIQNGRLKKMPSAGGSAIDYGEADNHQGGSFGPDGTLVFNKQHGEGLFRVRSGSTRAEALTTVNQAAGEAGHHWPHVLPDGKHALYTVEIDGKPYSEARIMLLSLETGQSRLLIDGGSDARYISTGHIVYWRLGDLWRIPFDLRSLQVGGAAIVAVRGVMLTEANGAAHFSFTPNGTLVYLPGQDVDSENGLVIVDRSGVARPITTERKAFVTATLSPDGTRLATSVIAANDSLWVLELDRGAPTRITFEAENGRPVWSPDGTLLAFTRHSGGETQQLHVVPADGGAPPQLVRPSPRTEIPSSWSRAGNVLSFSRMEEATGSDIWVIPMDDRRSARAWLATRFDEGHSMISPDGRWMAYASTESGRSEVYVRAFPAGTAKRQVSFDGGAEPRWRGDGREFFYRRGDSVLAADVATAGEGLRFSMPRVLFKGQFLSETDVRAGQTWDVLPDGQRFVFIQEFGQPRTAVTLVQNWFAEWKN